MVPIFPLFVNSGLNKLFHLDLLTMGMNGANYTSGLSFEAVEVGEGNGRVAAESRNKYSL